jgi:hypothetical protein
LPTRHGRSLTVPPEMRHARGRLVPSLGSCRLQPRLE